MANLEDISDAKIIISATNKRVPTSIPSSHASRRDGGEEEGEGEGEGEREEDEGEESLTK